MVESLKVTLTLLLPSIVLEDLAHLLGLFHHLSTFDLSSTPVEHPGFSNSVEELFCHSWQSTSPSLHRIVFPSQTEWTYQEEGDGWIPFFAEASP
jgi:hypothetical protein